jgi:hypothetical protein
MAMKRAGWCAMVVLILSLAVAAAPAGGQQKYTLGYGAGT